MPECVAEWLPLWLVPSAKDMASAAYLSIRHLLGLHLLPVVSLDPVICSLLLQPMSLQFCVTEVKQAVFPIWSTKGKRVKGGAKYLLGPRSHVKSPGEKRGLPSLVQGREASSWEGRKGGAQERLWSQSGASLQPSQPVTVSSSHTHTQRPGMPGVAVSLPCPPLPRSLTPPVHLAGHVVNM